MLVYATNVLKIVITFFKDFDTTGLFHHLASFGPLSFGYNSNIFKFLHSKLILQISQFQNIKLNGSILFWELLMLIMSNTINKSQPCRSYDSNHISATLIDDWELSASSSSGEYSISSIVVFYYWLMNYLASHSHKRALVITCNR